MYDFSKTESAKASVYFAPGVYKLKVVEVKLGESKKAKTPSLDVTFQGEEGTKLTESFFLTEKAVSRLQYLHEAWTGKKCEKVFKSESELETYFSKLFASPKAGAKAVIVGGEIGQKDVVFARLPFTGFVDSEDEYELGEFEEGDSNWKKFVKKGAASTSEVNGKPNGLLGDDDEETTIGKGKKTEKASAKSTKKAAAVETEEAEEDGDDMPW